MRANAHTRGVQLAAMLVVLVLLAPSAHAFFPWAGITSTNRIVYPKWPLTGLNGMDTNNDGDVSGPDEGLVITLEGGDYGWTEEEIERIREAFDVWENVTSSYVVFRYGPILSDPNIEIASDMVMDVAFADSVDAYNFMAIQALDDPTGTLPPGVLGITLIAGVLENTFVDVVRNGQTMTVAVSGGKLYDCDIVLEGSFFRVTEEGGEPEADLGATMVHEIGHMLGLGHTPLQNFDNLEEILDGSEDVPTEVPVMAMRNQFGELEEVGVTATMFPYYFQVEVAEDIFEDGAFDLAPDDIGGLSFLYPRGSQEAFFTIMEEARTQRQEGFPSFPISGGAVMAWCDVDGNDSTPRVPLFATMSGYYETQPAVRGRFRQMGMWKQIETIDGALLNATYTFTNRPLATVGSPFVDQTPEDYDTVTIWGGSRLFGWEQDFFQEVYRDGGNLIGVDKRDSGTALMYDPIRRKVVDPATDKSLDELLFGQKPMFGDPNDICMLNVATAGLASHHGIDALRRFRDDVMLQTGVGTAMAEAYYAISPTVAQTLLRQATLRSFAHAGVGAAEWLFVHGKYIALALVLTAAGLVALRLRRRSAAAALALLLALGLAFAATPAHALLKFMPPQELAKVSQDIVTGKVTSVYSHWTEDGRRIVTDVSVQVDDTLKGRLNKSGEIQFRQPGGQVGPVVRFVTDLPTFKVNEEVALFLTAHKSAGLQVVGGVQGKMAIQTDPVTGEKSITNQFLAAQVEKAKKADAEAAKAAGQPLPEEKPDSREATPAVVPLEDFKDYIREVVYEQAKEQAAEEAPAE